MFKGVGTIPISGKSYPVGVGYIILPENYKGELKRKEFIEDCYRRERVSIIIEGGTVKHDCYVTKEALQDIQFPNNVISEKQDSLGSAVIFIPEQRRAHPVIVGTISKADETNLFKENEYKVIRTKNGKFAVITLNGDTGTVGIKSFGGDINLDVLSPSNESKLNIRVSGSINIISSGNVSINSREEVKINSVSEMFIDGEKVNLGQADETILLGDKTEEVLDDIISLIDSLRGVISNYSLAQSASAGPAPLTPLVAGYQKLNADLTSIISEAQSVKNKLNSIKSEKIFIE